LDQPQQLLEQQAASLHPSVRDRFLELFAERSRARTTYFSMAAALQPPPWNILLTQLEDELATHV